MAVPQSAYEAGTNLRNNFMNLPIGHIVDAAIGHALNLPPPVATAKAALPVLSDFFKGVTGQAGPVMAASVTQPQGKGTVSAPAKASAPGAPPPGFRYLPSGELAMTPQAAAALPALNIPTAAAQSQTGAAPGGANAQPATAQDFVNRTIAANPNISWHELGSLASVAGRMYPQAKTPADMLREQYAATNDQQMQADMAAAKAAGDEQAYRKAIETGQTNLRAVLGSNPYFPQMPPG